MNSLTDPRFPEFEEIDHLLVKGRLFGKNEALMQANSYVAPHADQGDIPSMMKMANVYYTATGAIGSQGGITNKLLAAKFLHTAKTWATQAFLANGKTSSVTAAIRQIDVALYHGRPSDLSYGDVHILMSCYLQMALQIKKRLHLPIGHERNVIEECYRTIMRNGSENLKILAMSSMLALPGADPKIRQECHVQVSLFADTHFRELMKAKTASTVDLGFVQVVCRAARSVGNQGAAKLLAEKFGLGDQANKARNNS